MDLNKYQAAAKETATFPGFGNLVGLFYTGLGLTGESGEYAEKVKKMLREEPEYLALDLAKTLRTLISAHEATIGQCSSHVLDVSLEAFETKLMAIIASNPELVQRMEQRKEAAIKELGDGLWYIAIASECWGVPLEEVGAANITKLQSRKTRNQLHGNGDNR